MKLINIPLAQPTPIVELPSDVKSMKMVSTSDQRVKFIQHLIRQGVLPLLYKRPSVALTGESERLILIPLHNAMYEWITDNTSPTGGSWELRNPLPIDRTLGSEVWNYHILGKALRTLGSKALTDSINNVIVAAATLVSNSVSTAGTSTKPVLDNLLSGQGTAALTAYYRYITGLTTLGAPPSLEWAQRTMLNVGQGDIAIASPEEQTEIIRRIYDGIDALFQAMQSAATPEEQENLFNTNLAVINIFSAWLEGTSDREKASTYFRPQRSSNRLDEVARVIDHRVTAYTTFFYQAIYTHDTFTFNLRLKSLSSAMELLILLGIDSTDPGHKHAVEALTEVRATLSRPFFSYVSGLTNSFLDEQRQYLKTDHLMLEEHFELFTSARNDFAGAQAITEPPVEATPGVMLLGYDEVKSAIIPDMTLTAIATSLYTEVTALFSAVRTLTNNAETFDPLESIASESAVLPKMSVIRPPYAGKLDEFTIAKPTDDYSIDTTVRPYLRNSRIAVLEPRRLQMVRSTPLLASLLLDQMTSEDKKVVTTHRWVRPTSMIPEIPHPYAPFAYALVPANYAYPYTPMRVPSTINDVDMQIPASRIVGGKFLKWSEAVAAITREVLPRIPTNATSAGAFGHLAQALSGMGYFVLNADVNSTIGKTLSRSIIDLSDWHVYGTPMGSLIDAQSNVRGNAISGEGNSLRIELSSGDVVHFILWSQLPQLGATKPGITILPGNVRVYIPVLERHHNQTNVTKKNMMLQPVLGWTTYSDYFPAQRFAALECTPPSFAESGTQYFIAPKTVYTKPWDFIVGLVDPTDPEVWTEDSHNPPSTAAPTEPKGIKGPVDDKLEDQKKSLDESQQQQANNPENKPTGDPTVGSTSAGADPSSVANAILKNIPSSATPTTPNMTAPANTATSPPDSIKSLGGDPELDASSGDDEV